MQIKLLALTLAATCALAGCAMDTMNTKADAMTASANDNDVHRAFIGLKGCKSLTSAEKNERQPRIAGIVASFRGDLAGSGHPRTQCDPKRVWCANVTRLT